jgi:hypothetical protein
MLKLSVRIHHYRQSVVVLFAGLTMLAWPGHAKNKKPKTPPPAPKDEIQVVGHIPLIGGPVRRFLATQHYSSYYLYAEHEADGKVTLVDVTNVSRPAVLADMAYTPGNDSGSLTVVAGTAALVSSETAPATAAEDSQTIRIMDFSDPQNPKVAHEFTGVTAMSRDDRRGLIFVANADGIWILQQQLAQDPAVEEAYAHYVLYSH